MDNNTQRVQSRYWIHQRWGNIVADASYRFPLNWNQDTTHNSTYKKEIVSEIDDTEEIPQGSSPIN